MINQRNYAYFSTQKCDCCKRVRKIKTKMEIMDEAGGLLGEVALCPTCLKAFKGQAINKAESSDTEEQSVVSTESIIEYDDEDLAIDDYKAMGYQVESIL